MTALAQNQKPNPAAPAELSQFAFLIGTWRCAAKLHSANGRWETFPATWVGSFILNGHAIADEYTMMNMTGDVIVSGMNFRSYDAARRTWVIKWLNAFTGSWTDLAPSSFGDVTIDGPSISYSFKEPTADHAYTRATYTKSSATNFAWRGDQSADGQKWRAFMVVECKRST